MRSNLEYQSTICGECPSDYDFTKIENPIELKFLKWTDILQSIITRLKYNIEMFEYFIPLYLLNKVIKEEFKGFFSMLLSNISMLIAIDFSSLIEENNELKLDTYKTYCYDNPTLFKNANISEVLDNFKIDLTKAKKMFALYLDTPRNKLFAHIDEQLLDKTFVDRAVEKVSTQRMKEMLESLMKFLSGVWEAYNGHNLCFTIKNGEDYKKLAKSICTQYGNTSFT